jgi:hypothetical protein
MNRKIKNNEQPEPDKDLHYIFSGKKGNDAFKVPEVYFDTLPLRIRDKISAENATRYSFTWFRKQFASRWVWVPALSVSMLLLAIYTWMPENNNNVSYAAIGDTLNLNQAVDASYAGEAIFDEYVAVYKILESSESESQEVVSFVSTYDDDITDEEIVEYLNNQQLDAEVLSQI